MLKPLFKYHKCGDMKYLRELIETNSFYMAPRTKMNDMYDCFFSLSEEYIAEEVPGLPLNMLSLPARDNLLDRYHISIYKDVNPGITCFSEKCDNDMLWAYYTDSSKGVCLEFDFNDERDEFKSGLRKVIYTDDFMIQTKVALNILPFRKKQIFSSEEEWRIVFNKGNQKCFFSKSSLKNIYIGVRCKQEHVLELMNLTDTYGYNVRYHRMHVNRKFNHISFKPTDREYISEFWLNVIK
jgi:hypothetical protein